MQKINHNGDQLRAARAGICAGNKCQHSHLLVRIYRVTTNYCGALILLSQIAKLELGLQEAEYQKQQTELEGKIAVAEMGTKFNTQLHAQLGKLWTRITEKNSCVLKLNSMSLCLLLGKWHVAFLGYQVK